MIDRVHVSGGAERLQHTLAEALDPRAVELTVITLREGLPESEAALRDRGVRIVNFPADRFADLRRARALLDFIRAECFDLLHAHLVRSTILAGLAGRSTGTPVVATLHNTERRSGVGPALRIAERWVLRRATDRVIAVGWETASAHRGALGARAIDVIPNAVGEPPLLSAGERAEARRELGVPHGAPLLIAVGRIVPQKAFTDLLRAFAQLPTQEPAPQLRIVGRGRLEVRVAREIERLGLGARARLLGLRSDVPRLLAASDLYASSSHWEGLPVAMLEAMAAGLPVVATKVGDVPRVVDASCGVLVAPRDPAALAFAISGLVGDPLRREQLGACGRARVRANFGTRAWAERHMALYAEVVRTRPSYLNLPAQEEATRCAS
jgi:glycosyltransferase involved in cell wall biosynthesis